MRVGQIAIPVADLTKAEHFYTDVLGLAHAFTAPNVVAYTVGELRLLLTARERLAADDAPGVLIYFAVKDLKIRHTDWLAAGAADGGAPHVVATVGDTDIWIAFVRDPSGNLLGLIEELPTAT